MDVDIVPPPSKRRKQKAPTRGNIANLLGMKSVTPRSIAYVAVQVSRVSHTYHCLQSRSHFFNKLRFALSNASAWNENDGCFNYIIFYNNIVDFFEIPPGPAAQLHAQTLLAWWTRSISHLISVLDLLTSLLVRFSVVVLHFPRALAQALRLRLLSLKWPNSVLNEN